MDGAPPVLVDRQAGLAFVTLNRPEALNALDRPLALALRAQIRELRDDSAVRVVVVRGAGSRAFSVGADLKERAGMPMHEVITLRGLLVETVRALNALAKPTIAAVRGYAMGGGMEVALACDFIIAAESAQFALPEVTLGIIPGAGGTQTLARLVGKTRAKELIFRGRRIDAAEARQLGIVLEVVPDDGLDDAVLHFAADIAKNAPLAVQQAKLAIELGAGTDLETGWRIEAEAYNLCLLTEDREEGLRAFAERRPPRFQGR